MLPFDTIDAIMAQFFAAFYWTMGFIFTFFLILGLLSLFAKKYRGDTMHGTSIPSRSE